MRIQACSRVLAAPVNSVFSWPTQPEFSWTDFLSNYGPANLDKSNIVTDPIADCIHARKLFIPHNQFISGLNAITDVFFPGFREDPRAYTTGSPYNVWWTETTFTGPGTVKRESRLWGANTAGDEATQKPFRYIVYRPDFHASTFDDNASPFTLIAKTLFERVTAFDAYGNPTLAPPPLVQGFWLMLERGVVNVKQVWSPPEDDPVHGDSMRHNDRYFWDNPTILDNSSGYTAVRFRIGCGVDTKWFEIQFRIFGSPRLYISDDETFSESELIGDMQSASEAKKFGQEGSYNWTEVIYDFDGGVPTETPRYRLVGAKKIVQTEVKLIGGQLQVYIEGELNPFVWDLNVTHTFDNGESAQTTTTAAVDSSCAETFQIGDPIGLIEEVKVIFTNCQWAAWAIQPMKFERQMSLTSRLIQIGFRPLTEPLITAHWSWWQPPVYTFDTTYELDGTNIRYALNVTNDTSITGGNFADTTASLRAVTVNLPEVLRVHNGQIVELYPEEVVVQQNLNIEDLSIICSATLKFNNFSEISHLHDLGAPDLYWGEWASTHGLIAVTIETLVDYYNTNGTLDSTTGWQTVFTGYGNVSNTISTGHPGTFTMQCSGRELAMMSPKFAIPWMDAWNEYYVAAYLANICGVKKGTVGDSDLYFREMVPTDPYSDSPNGNAYFLPIGSGGNPLMRFSPGSRPWQILGKIGQQNGFIRYFDAFGTFHWEPFRPDPVAPEMVFFVNHNGNQPQLFSPTEAVFHGVVQRDITQSRTSLLLIGINAPGALWEPIVCHRGDSEAVYDAGSSIWDPTLPNFQGFENPDIIVDNQFANPDYANNAADRIWPVVRQPYLTAGYQVWHNPELYPGKWVGMVDVKSGLYDRFSQDYTALMVMSVTHRIMKGRIPTTDLNLRYVPSQT